MSENTLATKIAAIANDIDGVLKTGENEAQNYKYAEASKVFEECRKRLADKKIVILPAVTGTERITLSNEGRAPWVLTRAKFVFTLLDAESGEREDREFQGEGADSGDKGLNKALTAGLKYFLIQLFQIPTGDDPEADAGTDAATGQAGGASTGSSAPAPASAKPRNNGSRDERPITEGQGRRLYAIAMQTHNGSKPHALEAIGRACLAVADVQDSRDLERWAYEDVVAIVEGKKPMPSGPPDVPIDTEGLPEPGQQTTVDDNEPVPF